MTARDAAKFGCVLLIGMAAAFVAGLILASGEVEERPVRSGGSATMRKVYSPKILDDPYFIEQQRTNIETLERVCRESGEMCAEARAARRSFEVRD